MSQSYLDLNYAQLKSDVLSLKNQQMKDILKRGREKVSGNKTELQSRLEALIERKRQRGELEDFAQWFFEVTGI
ncbi:hypothetical protein BC829DRAFT_394826, partial [Chytridium lagenaria]